MEVVALGGEVEDEVVAVDGEIAVETEVDHLHPGCGREVVCSFPD